MVFLLFLAILIVSVLWSFWSLRHLHSPKNLVPKFEKRVRKILSGMITIPGR